MYILKAKKLFHMNKLYGSPSALTIFTSVLIGLLGFLQPLQAQRAKVRTIVIDAGHGGDDPGCLGKYSFEKEVALQIALKAGLLIRTHFPDVKVIFTRTDDTFLSLQERTEIANAAQADLFISVHCNASHNLEAAGTETYIMGLHASKRNLQVAMRENSVILQEDNYLENYQGFDPTSPISYIVLSNFQQSFQANSLALATAVESQFSKGIQKNSRGVKQAGFLVLARTAMPSVLIETGFLTNEADEAYLNTPLGQMEIAASIYRAFRNYKQSIEGEAYSY